MNQILNIGNDEQEKNNKENAPKIKNNNSEQSVLDTNEMEDNQSIEKNTDNFNSASKMQENNEYLNVDENKKQDIKNNQGFNQILNFTPDNMDDEEIFDEFEENKNVMQDEIQGYMQENIPNEFQGNHQFDISNNYSEQAQEEQLNYEETYNTQDENEQVSNPYDSTQENVNITNDMQPMIPNYTDNPYMNSEKMKKNKKLSEKQVLGIFIGILIIFVIVAIVLGVSLYSKKKNEAKDNEEKLAEQSKSQPIIRVEPSADGTTIQILVDHNKELDSVIYSWNKDQTTEKSITDINLKNFKTEPISVPNGENVLDVVARDIDGIESSFSQNFANDIGNDIEKPIITFDLTNESTNKYIKITVTDNVGLESVGYKWNSEDIQNVELQTENQKEISFSEEIRTGANTLEIIATDTSGNVTRSSKQFDGLEAPEVNFAATPDGASIIITATHPVGIKSIRYTLNGEVYANDDIQPARQRLEVTVSNLPVGESVIEATATSVDGVTSQPKAGRITKEAEPVSNTNNMNEANPAGY